MQLILYSVYQTQIVIISWLPLILRKLLAIIYKRYYNNLSDSHLFTVLIFWAAVDIT